MDKSWPVKRKNTLQKHHQLQQYLLEVSFIITSSTLDHLKLTSWPIQERVPLNHQALRYPGSIVKMLSLQVAKNMCKVSVDIHRLNTVTVDIDSTLCLRLISPPLLYQEMIEVHLFGNILMKSGQNNQAHRTLHISACPQPLRCNQ
jgi:hypothetical protein